MPAVSVRAGPADGIALRRVISRSPIAPNRGFQRCEQGSVNRFPAPWTPILTRSQETTREMLSAMSHNPMIRLPTMITWSVRVLIQVRNLASSARLWPGLIMA